LASHTRPSPNFDSRGGAAVRMVVLHYTGMPETEAALARLCDPQARVSAHYLIDEQGRLFALVPERHRAWHAGVSAWRRWRDVNAVSIGIELANPGHDWGYRPFPAPQIEALVALLREIRSRHPVAVADVVGHSDVAPARKRDPGELFPWRLLARRGSALWPGCVRPARVDPLRARELLRRIGYVPELAGSGVAACLRAFQRRFRPGRVDGVLDPETMGLLDAVVAAQESAVGPG